MSIKKKLGMGLGSAALGIALIGGGTYAYFSDTEVTANTFASGTLDLAVNPTTIIDASNLKPGDTMLRTFKLVNNGSLDIRTVALSTKYDNEKFGEHIRVNFLTNINQVNTPILSKTLAELEDMSPEATKQFIWDKILNKGGLPKGASHNLVVQFEFVDNGEDQNELQGQTLNLEWTFDAEQTNGSAK